MKISLILAALTFLCTSCVERGNVPHYILTDSPESKEEMEKHADRSNPNVRSYNLPKKFTH